MSLTVDLWIHVLRMGQFGDRDAARAAGTCVALRQAVKTAKPSLHTGPRSYLCGMGTFQKEFDADLRSGRKSMLGGPYFTKRRRHEIFDEAKDALERRDLIDLVHSWKREDTVMYEYVCHTLAGEYPLAVRAVREKRLGEEVAHERVIMDAIIWVVVSFWPLPAKQASRPTWMRALIFCVCFINVVLCMLSNISLQINTKFY